MTLIPNPVTFVIGSVASIANAALYASEGNYFAAVCNAIPVFGGGFSLLGKAGTASCGLMNFLKYGTAALSVGTGGYDIYQIGKENYQKYVINGEKFSWSDAALDTARVILDATDIAGGIKLATTDIPFCFVAGTLVETEDGQKPIEEVEVGDKVLSENPETGEIAYKTVEETYINETDELIHVHVNGETISATPNHPFYVDKFGWILAKNLRAGDILVLSNGEFVVVEWIQHEILENPIKVYNFEVQDFHTYFVGESSVLVHNLCETGTTSEGHLADPGSAQSRINIANGRTRFTPMRQGSNTPVSAGFQHVVDGHFYRQPAKSRSVFTITEEELKTILQRKDVVHSPVTLVDSGMYVRNVDTGLIVGKTSLKYGGNDTSWIKIFTDRAGNLITTFPIPEII